jgi:hypothetical protein
MRKAIVMYIWFMLMRLIDQSIFKKQAFDYKNAYSLIY